MGRRKRKIQARHISSVDRDVTQCLIKRLMKDGKKHLAENIVNSALKNISEEVNSEDGKILKDVLGKIKPIMEVKSRRVGGSTYPVPVEVRPKRASMLALKWLITGARARKGTSMSEKLTLEIRDALDGKGFAVKKREDTHKMAEANKAFEHFR